MELVILSTRRRFPQQATATSKRRRFRVRVRRALARLWRFRTEQSALWQAERQRIAEEANEKRRAYAKARARTDAGKFEPVVAHCVLGLGEHEKGQRAKARLSNTNRGAVLRGDRLISTRHHEQPAFPASPALPVVRQVVAQPEDGHKTEIAKARLSNTNRGNYGSVERWSLSFA
jgi:hypothetical protein